MALTAPERQKALRERRKAASLAGKTYKPTRSNAPRALADAETLWQLFEYDAETGHLYHTGRARATTGGHRATGKPGNDGYLRCHIDKKAYLAHRVIWKMTTGQEPTIIDHVNRDKADNRWTNLRNVTKEENSRNRPTCGIRRQSAGWITTINDARGKRQKYTRCFGAAIRQRHTWERELGYNTARHAPTAGSEERAMTLTNAEKQARHRARMKAEREDAAARISALEADLAAARAEIADAGKLVAYLTAQLRQGSEKADA